MTFLWPDCLQNVSSLEQKAAELTKLYLGMSFGRHSSDEHIDENALSWRIMRLLCSHCPHQGRVGGISSWSLWPLLKPFQVSD